MSKPEYTRPQAKELSRRLEEPRRFLQVITGARQVGKTTLVTQVAEGSDRPSRFVSADEPTLRGSEWIEQQWAAARLLESAVGAHLANAMAAGVCELFYWRDRRHIGSCDRLYLVSLISS